MTLLDIFFLFFLFNGKLVLWFVMLVLSCPMAGVHSSVPGRGAYGPLPRVSTGCSPSPDRTPIRAVLCATTCRANIEIFSLISGVPDLSCFHCIP